VSNSTGSQPRSDEPALNRAKAAAADRRSASLGRHPLRLVVDPDAVRDPRHVVEVADDLDRVGDGGVVEALRVQRVDICLLDLRCEVGELDRELAERALAP
jgi:hypothetical protein